MLSASLTVRLLFEFLCVGVEFGVRVGVTGACAGKIEQQHRVSVRRIELDRLSVVIDGTAVVVLLGIRSAAMAECTGTFRHLWAQP